MADFIVDEANKIDDKTQDGQAKVATIYSELFMGEADTVNQFKNYLVKNDSEIKTFYETNKDKKVESTDGATKTTETTTTEGVETLPKFKISITKNGAAGVEINGKIYNIKDNLEYLKTIDDADLQKEISEAIKFETGMEKAPIVGTPSKYLKEPGKRGVKKINPEWQKLQDMNKNIVTANVNPRIPKRKIR